MWADRTLHENRNLINRQERLGGSLDLNIWSTYHRWWRSPRGLRPARRTLPSRWSCRASGNRWRCGLSLDPWTTSQGLACGWHPRRVAKQISINLAVIRRFKSSEKRAPKTVSNPANRQMTAVSVNRVGLLSTFEDWSVCTGEMIEGTYGCLVFLYVEGLSDELGHVLCSCVNHNNFLKVGKWINYKI